MAKHFKRDGSPCMDEPKAKPVPSPNPKKTIDKKQETDFVNNNTIDSIMTEVLNNLCISEINMSTNRQQMSADTEVTDVLQKSATANICRYNNLVHQKSANGKQRSVDTTPTNTLQDSTIKRLSRKRRIEDDID